MVCNTAGHSNSRLHHLIIEQPEKCGPAWIAFSEYKWGDLTLQRYAQDAKLRAARMQAIDPKAMAAGSSNAHGTTASKAAIEAVMEYHPGYQPAQLAYDPKTDTFSKEDGSYDKARVDKNYTRYPIHARRGKAEESLQFMQARARKAAAAIPRTSWRCGTPSAPPRSLTAMSTTAPAWPCCSQRSVASSCTRSRHWKPSGNR